jgi:hypothetical protein
MGAWTVSLYVKTIPPILSPVFHVASIFQDNGLRIHDVFAECDFGDARYPMYNALAKIR